MIKNSSSYLLAFTLSLIIPLSSFAKCDVKIKYRSDNNLINICSKTFEAHKTASSSFIRGAWYDAKNQYMILKLKKTYYQYCSLPLNTWCHFKSAKSYGKYYNAVIKGRFDCRKYTPPIYQKF